MKLSENDIPESVLLYLFFEDFLFSFSKTDIVSVFFDNLMSIPFSYPITDVVSDHCSYCSQDYSADNMWLSPESSNKNHYIHSWYCGSDDWEWLRTGTRKGNKIIPTTKRDNEFAYPSNPKLDPIRFYERYHYQYEWENCKKNSDCFRYSYKKALECMHTLMISKKWERAI